jgi:hypothetical protein
MYNFIFYFIYSREIGRGKNDDIARLYGSVAVGICLLIHILFLLTLIRRIFAQGDEGYGLINTNIEGYIVILFVIGSGIYFNKRKTESVRKKYKNEAISLSVKNILKILALTLFPLVGTLLLSIRQ